ncbi:hypothetical protein DL93DRAFT_2161812 [Clavulina sp. PMI_390]|nr:hypothetical protein DL93DRAFT_2161812 [Clavulina sp. PMI_390]
MYIKPANRQANRSLPSAPPIRTSAVHRFPFKPSGLNPSHPHLSSWRPRCALPRHASLPASVTTPSPLRQSQHVASPQQQDLAARASAPPVLGSLKRARDEGTDLSENMNAKRPKA